MSEDTACPAEGETEPTAAEIQAHLRDALMSGKPFLRARAALAYLAWHCRTVGLDGSQELTWSGPEAPDDRPSERLGELTLAWGQIIGHQPLGPLPEPLENAEVSARRGDVLAWAGARKTVRVASSPDRKGHKKSREGNGPTAQAVGRAAGAIDALESHAALLRSLGLFAIVFEGDWLPSEDDEDEQEWSAALWTLVPLNWNDRPSYEEEAIGPLCELVTSDTDDEYSVISTIPLSVLASILWLAAASQRCGPLKLAPKSPEELAELAEAWRDAGYDREMFENTGDRWLTSGVKAPEPIVPGLIYRRNVTLLAAEPGIGKSTLAFELAVKAGSSLPPSGEAPTLAGLPIVRGEKPLLVWYFYGESRGDTLADPANAHRAAGWDATKVTVRRMTAASLRAHVEKWLKEGRLTAPDLVILDTARSLFDGDGNRAEDVRAFYRPLEDLAEATGAAVVVVHHYGKGGNTRLERIVGSGDWSAVPSMVLCMERSKGTTRLIVEKPNIPGVAKGTTYRLVRDEATFQHLPAPEHDAPAARGKVRSPAEGHADAGELDEAIMAVVRSRVGKGERVTRTSLYEKGSRPAELARWGRDPILKALRALIDAGAIIGGEDGLRPAEDEAAAPLAAE